MRRLLTACACCLLFPPSVAGAAESTTRVPPRILALEPNGPSVGRPDISANGRYVAFTTGATNLGAPDFNTAGDVYRFDRVTGLVELVSIDGLGIAVGGSAPSMSADGNYIAFVTSSPIVTTDTDTRPDVYVRGMFPPFVAHVSSAPGFEAAPGDNLEPSIAEDGLSVAFTSHAALVPSDTNGVSDVYLITAVDYPKLVSVSTAGTPGSAPSSGPSISGDGSTVAFYSFAPNLVPADTNGAIDVFVRDLDTDSTSLVSRSSSGALGNGSSFYPGISRDGSVVAFQSIATNLVPDGNINTYDVFVRDRSAETTTRIVARRADGSELSVAKLRPAISPDGTLVAWESPAGIPGDDSLLTKILVHDLLTDITRHASATFDGSPVAGTSLFTTVERTGGESLVAFPSQAWNLVPFDTNGFDDVFLRVIT